MSSFRDNHTHFTGSLPVEFVWQEMKRKKLELNDFESIWKEIFEDLSYHSCIESTGESEKKLLQEFKEKLKDIFGNDFGKNIKTFFDLYSLFQYWTKTNDKIEMQNLYITGTEAIAKQFYQEKVDNFEIIAGPLIDWDSTKLRIESMIYGLKKVESEFNLKDFGKLRLTFISDGDKYKNYSKEVLKKIFSEIVANKGWNSKISGFDFSGVEKIDNFKFQKEIITLIYELNNKNNLKLTISVHAGEDLFHNNPTSFINYFENLLTLKIHKICHGTFLWIPNKYLHLSDTDDQKRIKLLNLLGKKKIELELCPTANLILSPLGDYNEIPIKMFSGMGINFSINTDNRTIFSTNLLNEYKRLNLPL